jgi:hypothetical protein
MSHTAESAGFFGQSAEFSDGAASAFEGSMTPFPKMPRVVAAETDALLEETTTVQVRKGGYGVMSGTFVRTDAQEEPIEISVSDFQLDQAPPPATSVRDDFERILVMELAKDPALAARRALGRPARATPLAAAIAVVATRAPVADEPDGYEVPAPRSTVITMRSRRPRPRSARLSVVIVLVVAGLAAAAVAMELAPGRVTRLAHAATSLVSAWR